MPDLWDQAFWQENARFRILAASLYPGDDFKSYLSVYKFVCNFLKNEKLRKIFSVHPLLVGGNPFSTTSIYALILFLEKKWGVHYALGGTGKIIAALEKLMNEIGVKIIKNDEVIKIITDKKKISGVTTKSNKTITLVLLDIDFIIYFVVSTFFGFFFTYLNITKGLYLRMISDNES